MERQAIMSRRRASKLVHAVSTIWFATCAGYLIVLALRQAGYNWWIIFSLSGHSALIGFLLISFYLFAIFRGVSRAEGVEIEHPLTLNSAYLFFYDICPFLGGFSGCLTAIAESTNLFDFLYITATGSLVTTFVIWIIVDPALNVGEIFILPASRHHRRQRLAEAKAKREQERLDKEKLLEEAQTREQQRHSQWQNILLPQAERLAALLSCSKTNHLYNEKEAVNIGVNAWQLGGIECMQMLHSMATEIYRKNCQNKLVMDYISTWWDGIGSWRCRWLKGQLAYL